MDAIDLVAGPLYWTLRALGAAGVSAAKQPPNELRGTAHGLGCIILGTLWLRRRPHPSWEAVSQSWERASDAQSGVDPTLYGRLCPDDAAELLRDNADAFERRVALIAEAKHTIDLATYYIRADATGRRVATALLDAARRGVRVRLIADAYITRKKDYEGQGLLAFHEELVQGGIAVKRWRDPARPYDASHRKLLLIDEHTLVIGGRNVADTYSGPDWRDVEVLLRGPSAASAAPLFQRTWDGAPEPPPAPGEILHATTPADVLQHRNFLYLLQCLRQASCSIDIENAYYLGHPALTRQLAAAVARGVRVRVLTNSHESNDLDFANHRLYTAALELLDLGAELYHRRGAGKTLHCKYFVVDGEWLGLGSSNLDFYSPRFCTEANLHIRDRGLGERLGAWFEEGIATAPRVTDREAIARHRDGFGVGRWFDTYLQDFQ